MGQQRKSDGFTPQIINLWIVLIKFGMKSDTI